MHYILGIMLRDSDHEILEDETPANGNFTRTLSALMAEGGRRIMQNPNIKQINIYEIKQGQRILTQTLLSK